VFAAVLWNEREAYPMLMGWSARLLFLYAIISYGYIMYLMISGVFKKEKDKKFE
jgi:hypothetical protein